MSRKQSKIKLLLLSGGSLVGRNVLDMASNRRESVQLIATNSDTKSPTIYEFDKVYLTPTTLGEPDEFEKRVLHIIEGEKPDLIIPCRDDDVIFLANLKERRPDLSDKMVCGNLRTAGSIYDKLKSWEFSVQHDLPFVPTVSNKSEAEVFEFLNRYGFPLLAKPRKGFASKGIYILNRERHLKNILEKQDYVVQKFLGDREIIRSFFDDLRVDGMPLFYTFEGLKHSIQIWIAPDGSAVDWFCSKNVNQGGTSLTLEKYEGEDSKELAVKCLDAFSESGWRGPVNIQCQKSPEGDLFIYEYNGRISGASAARYLMGFDELNLMVGSFLHSKIPSESDLNSRKVLRYFTDYTVPNHERIELERKGVFTPGKNALINSRHKK